MLLIECPWCGERAETEFSYGGEAGIRRPADPYALDDAEWADYLFIHEFGHHFAGLADEYYTSAAVYEPPENITEPYEPNVTALLDPENLKWGHLVAPNTPLPTPWPKGEFEEHSIAVQERRAQMRANNAPEAEMNGLFRYTRQFVEELFAESDTRDTIGAFEGAKERIDEGPC